jgi:hypothetical protein
LSLVSLYQTGLIDHLPDLPLPAFDSGKVSPPAARLIACHGPGRLQITSRRMAGKTTPVDTEVS